MASPADAPVGTQKKVAKDNKASASSLAHTSDMPAHKIGFWGLRSQFLFLILAIYFLTALFAFFQLINIYQSLVTQLSSGYATQYARLQQTKILAKIEREVVLAQKLAESPLLASWAKSEDNLSLKKQALAELDSYRRLFSDKSVFFIIDKSKHYYFNNQADEYRGRELQYALNPDDPQSSWYFKTIKEVSDFTLHVDNNYQLGLTKVWINAVVKDKNGEKVGLGGSGLDLTAFLSEVVVSKDPGVSTILIDDHGYVQGHSDAKLMEHNSRIKNESERLKIFSMLDPGEEKLFRQNLAHLVSGQQTITHFQAKSKGHQITVGAASMPSIGWTALVFVDPIQVVSLRQFLPILALITAALLVSLLLVSYAIEKRVLKRLRLLTGFTQKLAMEHYRSKLKNDFSKVIGAPIFKASQAPASEEKAHKLKLQIDGSDEIGQLASSFNYLSSTLEDYTQNLELKVDERTKELHKSNNLLAASNKLVMESIHYALIIQTALLAKNKDMEETFCESFAYWQPRDIVGGDFYALYKNSDKEFLLAVADCTGHGVPGALMTMASKALLDRAIDVKGIGHPSLLLEQLHKTLGNLLSSEDNEGSNGLDIALLYGKIGEAQVRYAGARIPLWIQPPGQPIEVVNASKVSIGYAKSSGILGITEHELEVPEGTRLFLTSDGILDQPGGDKGFGLGQRRLQEALCKWEKDPLDGMANNLQHLIKNYSGSRAQRDDIVIVGVKVGSYRKMQS